MKRLTKQSVIDAAQRHPGAVCILAFIATAALVWLLAWFLLISGLNQPIEFIYEGF